MPLEGLFLKQNLAGIYDKVKRPFVFTVFVTDQNGIVANCNEEGRLQVPPQIRSQSDWQLFQELMAQSDVVISGSSYLKRYKKYGDKAENILYQYDPGGEFESLGQWRLERGKQRQPDLVFLTHHLNFEIPEGILHGDRKIMVFTTHSMANSKEAGALTDLGVTVVGSGETGVNGERLIHYLGKYLGYHVIMMATGPSVLDLLLEYKQMDLLYVTEVKRVIPFQDPEDIRMILPEGRRVMEMKDFTMTQRYLEENATLQDGTVLNQEFQRFDKKGFIPLD